MKLIVKSNSHWAFGRDYKKGEFIDLPKKALEQLPDVFRKPTPNDYQRLKKASVKK